MDKPDANCAAAAPTNGDALPVVSAGATDPSARPRRARRWITDAIVLAAVPATAYVFAYVYETAYFTGLGVPDDLVEVRYPALSWAILAVVTTALPLGCVVYLVSLFWPKAPGPLSTRLLALSPLLCLFGISLIYWTVHWINLVYLIIFAFLYFAFPLITQRRGGSYREKLIAQDETDGAVRSPLVAKLRKYTEGLAWLPPIALGFVVGAHICVVAGEARA